MGNFDDTELCATLGGRAPVDDRAQRVRWLGEAARALLRGELPGAEARMFLGSAILAWLQSGGDLETEYFRVHRRGSHHTPARLWQSLIGDEDNAQSTAVPSPASSTTETEGE